MRHLFVFLSLLAGSCSQLSADSKPNVFLILADDLGWSDLGCYGGEIATPNLDGLAKDGLQFHQFYNSARCSPSRAAILTGLHPHQAGFPNLSGTLSSHAATIPEVLQPQGYRCTMVGKWHLNEKHPPTERGFDEFYGMLGGFNSCWQEDPFYTRWPVGRMKRVYEQGKFYATDVFADYAIDFIGDGKSGNPWFQYLAFNAPHFPLHAPESAIAKYESLYFQKGWDVIRTERLERQHKLGLLPSGVKLTPRAVEPANKFNGQTGWADKEIPAWESLPEDRRHDLARRMAVYAAMVDLMDQAIGRVLAHLKTTGHFENTLIFFLSDNGACAEWDPYGFDKKSGPQNMLHVGEDLKSVGGPDSYISYGSGWANACNTPWRLFKHYNHEGGVRTPCIVHWPAGMKTKGRTPGPGYITDFMPTICAVTGATYPLERAGQAILPQEGISLVPAMNGEPLAKRNIYIEHEGNRSVRDGDWKLVSIEGKPWELYNLAVDPTEMNDLQNQEPQRTRAMSDAWTAWADRCMVTTKAKAEKPTAALAIPQIAQRLLTIQCDVSTDAKQGVILAHGGNQNGYALHLKDGHVIYTVRINGIATAITAPSTISGKFAVKATLGAGGEMALSINEQIVTSGKAAGLIPQQPIDDLSIGEDTKTAVGDYESPNKLKGTVSNVRIGSP